MKEKLSIVVADEFQNNIKDDILINIEDNINNLSIIESKLTSSIINLKGNNYFNKFIKKTIPILNKLQESKESNIIYVSEYELINTDIQEYFNYRIPSLIIMSFICILLFNGSCSNLINWSASFVTGDILPMDDILSDLVSTLAINSLILVIIRFLSSLYSVVTDMGYERKLRNIRAIEILKRIDTLYSGESKLIKDLITREDDVYMILYAEHMYRLINSKGESSPEVLYLLGIADKPVRRSILTNKIEYIRDNIKV